jgi:hypothetical protein
VLPIRQAVGSSGHRTFRITPSSWQLRTTAITTVLGIACLCVSVIDTLLLSGALTLH